MKTLLNIFTVTCLGLMVLVGCGGDDAATDGVEPTQAGAQDGVSGENPEIEAALAKLSAEDRALAEKQADCVVGGDALGSMGMPIKLDLDGTPVFICCEGCRDSAIENKDEILANLVKE